MQRLFFQLIGLIPVLYPAAAVLADSPPPSADQAVIIFREDFQDSVVGQTSRSGHWTTSTEGSGAYIYWGVMNISPVEEPNMVFQGRGDHPWRGEWRSEPIDISDYRDVEISIEVYSDIYSTPDDNCYIHFFYRIDGGDPVVWFCQTGDLNPRKAFVNKTSSPISGESLEVIIRASTELAIGEEYLFRDIRVSGRRSAGSPAGDE